jgi:hypothetical protein
MSGHVGSLTPQQEAALERFRIAVRDLPNKPEDTDHYYLRWLRAKKFKVHKAERMFRKVRAIIIWNYVADHHVGSCTSCKLCDP